MKKRIIIIVLGICLFKFDESISEILSVDNSQEVLENNAFRKMLA